MGFGWKEIVPNDPFIVRVVRPIGPNELSYITQIYQPLLGPLSVSLYITLYHEQLMDDLSYRSHRVLMSTMTTSLDQLVKARGTLEAIGLMRTIKIVSEQDEQVLYEYHLQPPLPPASFFGDDMLSIILLNRVGKIRYRFLREKFVGRLLDLEVKGDRSEITKRFDEVFQSISPSELAVSKGSETEMFLSEMETAFPTQANKAVISASSIQFKKIDPDFVFLEATMPKMLGDQRRLKEEIRDVLREISFFYRLDDMQLSYFLQEPYIYDDHNEIDAQRLKSYVKDWYIRNHHGEQPHVQKVEDPLLNNTGEGKSLSQSKEEEHKEALAKLSPISLLEQYQGGGKASPADLKIVDELVDHYKLNSGVINVLLEYVMMTNNKQLPKALILKIASHWKRLGIQNVDQALDQAKQLYNDMKSRPKQESVGQSQNRRTKSSTGSSTPKKDDLPEWVVRQMKQDQLPMEQEEVDEAKKKEVNELLRALGEIEE